jgi:hypothetical protein
MLAVMNLDCKIFFINEYVNLVEDDENLFYQKKNVHIERRRYKY